MSTLTDFYGGGKGARNVSLSAAGLVTDPTFLPWFLSHTIGGWFSEGAQAGRVRFNVAAAWAYLAKFGNVVTLTGGAGYETILDITGQFKIIANIIGPGLAAAGDTVNMKITVDDEETIINAVAVDAGDRLISASTTFSGPGYNGAQYWFALQWGGPHMTTGIQRRFPKVEGQSGAMPVLRNLPEHLSESISLICADSIKIEVETSAALSGENAKSMALIWDL